MYGPNGQVADSDKPLDFVQTCADPFCRSPIYFSDRCITDKAGNHYCSERCFVGDKGGSYIKAGTEELTI